MENETAVFNDGRGYVVRAMPEQLHAVYFVYSGWDVWATDQEFWIVELDNALIIVSDEDREIIQGFLTAWKQEIIGKSKGFEAACGLPPMKYRKKFFGFLPRIQVRFTITSPDRLHDFPAWNVTGPLPAFLRF